MTTRAGGAGGPGGHRAQGPLLFPFYGNRAFADQGRERSDGGQHGRENGRHYAYVQRKDISSFPDFSVMVIFRILPSAIRSFTFFRRFSPWIENDSFDRGMPFDLGAIQDHKNWWYLQIRS